MSSDAVSLSAIDTDRFGVTIARSSHVTRENLPEINQFCHDNQVKLLIGRCATTDVEAVHAMELDGFLLMDTLVYLKKMMEDYSPPDHHAEVTISTFDPSDLSGVVEVAGSSFTGYRGHYHADTLLDSVKATEVYSSWAERCCVDPTVASHVLVAKLQNRVVGFRAIRVNTPDQAEFILSGVAPEARKKGVYRSFVIEGLRWCKEKGAKEVLISTLLVNIPVQKTCEQLGFTAHNSFYTFHKWFDQQN